ncbi:MAG TPA: tryptophan synthase subunit alpha [Polyangiales bacterium]|nr:tryptophan synthase subunit alpha [Polyangiales bacterium]
MGRIADAFAKAGAENRAALVIYLCAGDPDLKTTEDLIVTAADAGADVIELGVPFSDPTADGPAIQRAAERSLRGGTTLAKVLDTVRAVRTRTNVPILLFGYYNPVLGYGEQRLVDDAAECGVDGFLIVDLPPEESAGLRDPAIQKGLDFVPLVAPTSNPERIAQAGRAATSFIYYVSMTGVTGSQATDLRSAAERAASLQAELDRPVALGFGVKTKDDVATVAPYVGGVVVGSAVVRVVEDASTSEGAVTAVRALVSELATGLTRQ